MGDPETDFELGKRVTCCLSHQKGKYRGKGAERQFETLSFAHRPLLCVG